MRGHFLTSLGAVTFSRRAVLRGVSEFVDEQLVIQKH